MIRSGGSQPATPYLYVGCNPVSFSDPSGHSACEMLSAASGVLGIAGGLATIATGGLPAAILTGAAVATGAVAAALSDDPAKAFASLVGITMLGVGGVAGGLAASLRAAAGVAEIATSDGRFAAMPC